jgi:predicted nucleic-acid-binding protein
VIWLDTNVFVRFLTMDDPVRSPRAAQILEVVLSDEAPGFVSSVVLAETAWVLASRYRQGRAAVAEAMEGLLRLNSLQLEHPRAAAAAVTASMYAGADFADALIGAIAAEAGCTRTLTFDRRAARLPGFELA